MAIDFELELVRSEARRALSLAGFFGWLYTLPVHGLAPSDGYHRRIIFNGDISHYARDNLRISDQDSFPRNIDLRQTIQPV